MQEVQVQFLSWEDHLEKKMATHSSILAWKTPLTEESGGLQFMGSEVSLVSYSPWGRRESDMTKQPTNTHIHSLIYLIQSLGFFTFNLEKQQPFILLEMVYFFCPFNCEWNAFILPF